VDESAFLRPPPYLDAIIERSKALDFSMPSEARTGAMLRMLSSSKPGGKFLELGTGTGISTAWLLDGMSPDAHLTTVDNNAITQTVARDALGHDSRLEIVTADGIDYLRSQKAGSFKLIFADAIPGKCEALESTLALLCKGSFYVIDDMLPQSNWPDGHDVKASDLLADLSARSEFRSVGMAWSSGLVILVKGT